MSSRCLREGSCATTFPSPSLFGASFNRSLWRLKGGTQGVEHRALFNLNGTRGSPGTEGFKLGLNGWAPNINIVRDPRYGRNSELPSEDPYLNGQYAVAVVRGMQEGDDPAYPLLIHATLKHYTAYSIETDRFGVSGNVSSYDLFDSFLPQYRAGFVEGKAGGAMCSCKYWPLHTTRASNGRPRPCHPCPAPLWWPSLSPPPPPPPPCLMVTDMSMNHVPSCANDGILNTMVRSTWGREDALIVTDCFAVESMFSGAGNHFAKDVVDATTKSLTAGVDLNTG